MRLFILLNGIALLAAGCASVPKQTSKQAPIAELQREAGEYPGDAEVAKTPAPSRASGRASDAPDDPAAPAGYSALLPTGTGRLSAPGVPLESEVPAFRFEETRTTSVRAGIATWGPKPLRHRIVPEFAPIELTEEEKRILGEPEEDPGADLLAFYRPPASAEQGVMPFESHVTGSAELPPTGVAGQLPSRTTVTGIDIASVGRFIVPTFGRTGAAVYPGRAGAGAVYSEGAADIGYVGPRDVAGRAPTVDY